VYRHINNLEWHLALTPSPWVRFRVLSKEWVPWCMDNFNDVFISKFKSFSLWSVPKKLFTNKCVVPQAPGVDPGFGNIEGMPIMHFILKFTITLKDVFQTAKCHSQFQI
jgi:hypothetical protein